MVEVVVSAPATRETLSQHGTHLNVLVGMPYYPEEPTTVVASSAIRAGYEEDFKAWADELGRLARVAAGYRAAICLGQTAGFQHLLFHFDHPEAAKAWLRDPKIIGLFASADRYSTCLIQVETGDGVSFELPSDASASKWKRFVATWLTVFPVLLVVSSVIRLILNDVPAPLQLLPSSLLLTAILQWVILPRLQRHARFWLLQGQDGRLKR